MENDPGINVPPPLPATPIRSSLPRKTGSGWKAAALILGALLFLSGIWNLQHLVFDFLRTGSLSRAAGPRLEELIVEENQSAEKIAVIPVEGIIRDSEGLGGDGYSMVERIQDQLKIAERDDHVKAVLLKVDSPGGEVLASDDIYNAIVKFQTNSSKPVIASMGSLAASGGYYVSAPCRWIVANELTITGSIGVIMHGFNYRGLMDKVGLRPQVFKSGQFKDMLSPDKEIDPKKQTPEEKAELDAEAKMIQSLIDQTFEKFKSVIAAGRGKANDRNQSNPDKGRKLSSNWTEYADGRILSGKEALHLGFVDEIGNWEKAVESANRLAKTSKANLVTYQQPFDLSSLFHLFGKSDVGRIKVDLGFELSRLKVGHLYFLVPGMVR